MKAAVKRYCNDGHDILTAKDMQTALTERPVRGTTAGVFCMNDKNITLKLQKIPKSVHYTILGVSNGSIQFRKFWPLLQLLAKITRVLACWCSQIFCNCSHARILVNMCSIVRNFVNPAL